MWTICWSSCCFIISNVIGYWSASLRLAYGLYCSSLQKGHECFAEYHRPLSMASICSKVIEHTLFSDITQHLDKHSFLMDAQHGFHKRHSDETQLISTIYNMACILSNSIQIDTVFLHFAKAYDKVPHQRLFLKLEYNGIRSNTLELIGSFLTTGYNTILQSNLLWPRSLHIHVGTMICVMALRSEDSWFESSLGRSWAFAMPCFHMSLQLRWCQRTVC